jgi:hypothetical protein
MSKAMYYEGQEVGCLMFGEGVIDKMGSMTISVSFDGHGIEDFYTDGTYMQHLPPTLYPIDQYREIIANLPAPQPEAWKPRLLEWCWFWNDIGKMQPVLSKFIGIEDGQFRAEFHKWCYCAPFTGELPEHIKEVQP